MQDSFEVDILELIKKHLLALIAATLVMAGIVYGASFLLPNTYSATTSMYILRRDGYDRVVTADTEELSYANTISGDVLAIMNSSLVRQKVSEALGMSLGDYSIVTQNEGSSRLVTLTVTGEDPEAAALIANSIVDKTAESAIEIMNIKAINVIDAATPAAEPSGPDHKRYALYGAAAGFAIMFAILFVREAADTRIRDGEAASQLLDLPVVGQFANVN